MQSKTRRARVAGNRRDTVTTVVASLVGVFRSYSVLSVVDKCVCPLVAVQLLYNTGDPQAGANRSPAASEPNDRAVAM